MNNKRIETVANLAAIIMFVLVGSLAAARLWGPESSPPPSSPSSRTVTPYAVGEPTDLLPADEFRRVDHTVLLIVQSGCRFCTASMPFYQRLLDGRATSGRQTRFVAMTVDPVLAGSAYLTEHKLAVDEVIRYPINKTSRIQGTPTLITVNASGVVVGNWTGRLSPENEREVESLVHGPIVAARSNTGR